MDQRISDSSSNCTRHSHGLDDNGIVNSNIGGRSIQQLLRSSGSHQEILESHANSATNALIYISVVLLMYILAMAFIVIRYVLMKSSHSPPYYFGSSKNKV